MSYILLTNCMSTLDMAVGLQLSGDSVLLCNSQLAEEDSVLYLCFHYLIMLMSNSQNSWLFNYICLLFFFIQGPVLPMPCVFNLIIVLCIGFLKWAGIYAES